MNPHELMVLLHTNAYSSGFGSSSSSSCGGGIKVENIRTNTNTRTTANTNGSTSSARFASSALLTRDLEYIEKWVVANDKHIGRYKRHVSKLNRQMDGLLRDRRSLLRVVEGPKSKTVPKSKPKPKTKATAGDKVHVSGVGSESVSGTSKKRKLEEVVEYVVDVDGNIDTDTAVDIDIDADGVKHEMDAGVVDADVEAETSETVETATATVTGADADAGVEVVVGGEVEVKEPVEDVEMQIVELTNTIASIREQIQECSVDYPVQCYLTTPTVPNPNPDDYPNPDMQCLPSPPPLPLQPSLPYYKHLNTMLGLESKCLQADSQYVDSILHKE